VGWNNVQLNLADEMVLIVIIRFAGFFNHTNSMIVSL
jgi:hypothetical protein